MYYIINQQLGSAEDDLDSETETAQQIMDLKKTLMSKCLPSLPKWKPQETVEKLKKVDKQCQLMA